MKSTCAVLLLLLTHFAICILQFAFCISPHAAAQNQPPAKPLRLIVEAEDFQPAEGDWAVKDYGTNYYCNTFAVTFLSRGRYLSAPEQGEASTATREIEIPRDGTFEVWARYEQPYEYAVEFDLEIQQGGKAVFQRRFGRVDQPKLWAFGKGLQPQVLWEWGGGDNIVWEGRDKVPQASRLCHLKQGKATLVLKKGPQKAEQAARRNVDVIVLTDDTAGIEKQLKQARYLPLDGWLTQGGDEVFLEVTNPKDSPASLAVHFTHCTEHSPYWVHVRDWPPPQYLGSKVFSDKPLKPEQYLAPGEKSASIGIGGYFDALNEFQWKVQVVCGDGKPAAGRKVRLAFSTRTADGKQEILRDEVFTIGPDNSVTFFLDSDLRRTKRIRTVEEDLERLAKLVRSFPKKGKRPEQILIYGIMGFSSGIDDKGRTGELAREIALHLGSNTLPEVKTPVQNAMIDVRDVPTKDLAAYCDKLKKEGKADRVKVVSLGDEIHVGDGAKSPDHDPAFREYLKKKGLKPDELGLKSLDEAKLELKNKQSRLYYHSHVFGMERAIAHLKERTDILEANLPKGVVTGANYSPHPYYWPKEGQWVRVFRNRGMTLPWSEDYAWQIPEANQQVIGYMMTALRCGAKYNDMPIQWYAMPHYPGTTPDNLRRAYYSAIGHGAKQMNFFCATPLSVGYTENHIAGEATETWKTIHELVHETGMFEHVVYPGKVRQGEVALLMSFAQDLWDTDPAYNHERKCLYMALRHGGYGVEFLTEEDIADGRHNKFKTIYIVGNHLETATAKALKQWVAAGGALAGIAGGGFFNEHNQPLDVLNEVYGIKEQKVERRDTVIMSKQQLPRLKPLDTITWHEPVKRTFPALAFKQTIKPLEKTKVRATYADGSPAVTENTYDGGAGFLFGSFISSAYVREAIPRRPFDRGTTPDSFNHFLPTEFDSEFGDIITSPCGEGEVRYDVLLDEPLVEVSLLESPHGIAAVLVNWNPKPKDVTLTIQYIPEAFKKVTSVRQGAVPVRRDRRSAVINIRVDVADMILLEK